MPHPRSPLPGLAVIAVVVAGAAGAFAYTAGWLSPHRITPKRVVDALAPPGGPAEGHRRNHAKGICFTGMFEASGEAASLSRASLFAQGQYPVVGRFNLAGPDPTAGDDTGRVRGLSIQVKGPGGAEWRSGMIIAPFFPVATPDAFYALLTASGSKDSGAMPAFIAAHPEFGPFGNWAKTAPWTPSYAQNQFNGLNAFNAVAADGTVRSVRWSAVPTAAVEAITPAELAKRGPNALEDELRTRLEAGPVRYTMQFTVANAGDPTADPSKAWPVDRRTVNAGSLVVQRLEAEADGRCRDLNYDPTVLPDGLATGDDPFPAARSAAYAVSYDRRTAEDSHYPRAAAR
jgi:catalase